MPDESSFIQAKLRYVINDGIPPVMYVDWPDQEHKAHPPAYEEKLVNIQNGRDKINEFNLRIHGFAFIPHKTNVMDFYNDEQVTEICYPEVEELVIEHTGCKKVIVFDHTIRTADRNIVAKFGVREPVKAVHNDNTEKSAPQRLKDILGEEKAKVALKRRFAIVQVWRPIKPVEADPLAICDGRTIPMTGFIKVERRYPHRTAEVFHISYNPKHNWLYFPNMGPDEALIFKVFDTSDEDGVRFTAHSAFEDPTSKSNAEPRESIELRAMALF